LGDQRGPQRHVLGQGNSWQCEVVKMVLDMAQEMRSTYTQQQQGKPVGQK